MDCVEAAPLREWLCWEGPAADEDVPVELLALGGVLSFARARGCGTVADAAVVCVVWAAIREGT